MTVKILKNSAANLPGRGMVPLFEGQTYDLPEYHAKLLIGDEAAESVTDPDGAK